jgi:CubicO group peptidase (beta-lactamase class C family)
LIVPLLIAVFGIATAPLARPQVPDTSSPGAAWETVSPESVGYSSLRFNALTTYLKTQYTTAMVVTVHGKVVYQYGDVARVSVIASVRKSVLSMLYGNYVWGGKIDLEKTVKQIGLDDKQPFLPIEENAKLEQLLAGRSGIYIVPDKTDPHSADSYQPKRGTELPGTHFSYNEWDFNAAGTAFEKLTGKNIYDALEMDLARPIGMQDFDRARQVKTNNLPFSVHPQYPMFLSTRDMARIGQLMLRQGNWNGKQVIPGDWTRYSTLLWTPFAEMNPDGMHNAALPQRWGFGLMWFVWDEPAFLNHNWMGPMQGAFIAEGSGGQYIAVLPAEDMVIAHKVDLDPYRGAVNETEWNTILNLALGASCFDSCPNVP